MSLGIKKLTPEILANIALAIFAFILVVRFNRQYTTYAWIVAGLFVVYDIFHSWKNGLAILSEIHLKNLAVWGILAMYILFNLASLARLDSEDIHLTIAMTKFTLPLWLLLYINGKYDVQKGLIYGISLGALALTLVGAYQFIHHPVIGFRIISLFQTGNQFATMIALLLPFTVYGVYFFQNKLEKSFEIIVTLLLIGNLVLTRSRGGILGIAVAIVFSIIICALLLARSIGWKKIMTAILAAFIIAGSGAYVIGTINHERFKDSMNFNNGEERVLLWKASLRMWEDNKLLGIGISHFNDTYYSAKYHPKEGREKNLGVPHSTPLQFLACTGIVGLIGYLLHLLTTFVFTCQEVVNKRYRALAAAFLISFGAFTAQGLVDMTITSKTPAQLYFLLLGFFLSMILKNRKQG